jgi:hypothetical protein
MSQATTLPVPTHAAAWNTMRGYSQSGQRISFVKIADGRILFCDLDRMIDGVLNVTEEDIDAVGDTRSLRDIILDEYDHGRYTSSLFMISEWDYATQSAVLKMMKDRAAQCDVPQL